MIHGTGIEREKLTEAEQYCSFCGKEGKDIACLAVHESSSICNECVALSAEIILEQLEKGRVVDLPPWN